MTSEERARRLLRGAKVVHVRDNSEWYPSTCVVCGMELSFAASGFYADSLADRASALVQSKDLVPCR